MKLDCGDRLVVASHNEGKVRELQSLLAPFDLQIVSAAELKLPEPDETGVSYEENAALKARAAASESGILSLADDSGFAVEALGGDPGIYSARWAGPTRDFGAAMQLVHDKVLEVGKDNSTNLAAQKCSFIAVLCLADPQGQTKYFRGEVEGTIAWPPRGTQGFGYDSLFLPTGYSRTFGEMDAGEKHGWQPGQVGLSHRARAFSKFASEYFQLEA